MNLFCVKCGGGVKPEFWMNKKYFRCIVNPDHFFSEDMLKHIKEVETDLITLQKQKRAKLNKQELSKKEMSLLSYMSLGRY